MIECKLSRMMGDRRKTIQQVHDETGLSRNTISLLYHNKVKRIDFETLEKLCACLRCSTGDLLEYRQDGEQDELMFT